MRSLEECAAPRWRNGVQHSRTPLQRRHWCRPHAPVSGPRVRGRAARLDARTRWRGAIFELVFRSAGSHPTARVAALPLGISGIDADARIGSGLSAVPPVTATSVWSLLDRYRGNAPRRLTALGLALAVAAAAAAGVGAWQGGIAHGVAAGLWLACGAVSYRARRLTRRCPLGAAQREALLGKLSGLAPLEVRVSAVDEPQSIRYARELRNVMTRAAWPALGVFKARGDQDAAGVALAVRNIVAPPGEAIRLLETLRRAGVRIDWAHKPELTDDRTIEIQVGPLG
jgi:hypothetical protein